MTNQARLGGCRVGIALDRALASAEPEEAYKDRAAVARLIRDALRQAGLGAASPEAPLCDIVAPGMTVLMKPNWVHHCNGGFGGMACMVTHPTFILAALEEVLKAKPRRVILGDAPIQGCDWDKLIAPQFRADARELGAAAGADVELVDFRRVIVPTLDPADGIRVRAERTDERQVHFDLGPDSMLEPVSTPAGRFRGICYSPDTLARTHYRGRHEYLLCREAFEADVVLSLPKLKTHRRSGVTAALKNLVGLNGDKDLLPHHRIGGTRAGGDCYEGKSAFKRLGEYFCDLSDRNIGNRLFSFWRYGYAAVRRLATRPADGHLEAAWHGNDTTWRMVVDLNRMLIYGRPDGTMADVPQRKLYSLTDAVVCGEAEGPLRPEPVGLGAATFSDCAPAADAINAALLRLDYRRIPLLREAFGRFRWPLSDGSDFPPTALLGGRSLSVDEVARDLGVPATPPAGWVGHIEWTSRGAERPTPQMPETSP